MRWPKRSPYDGWPSRRVHDHRAPAVVIQPSGAVSQASPSAPVVVTAELTDPELARLENVEVILPEGVELVALTQQVTPLPDKGRLIEGKILEPNRISFTVVATTTLGVTMIEGLKNGLVNIRPTVSQNPDGLLTVRMSFDDIPKAG